MNLDLNNISNMMEDAAYILSAICAVIPFLLNM